MNEKNVSSQLKASQCIDPRCHKKKGKITLNEGEAEAAGTASILLRGKLKATSERRHFLQHFAEEHYAFCAS